MFPFQTSEATRIPRSLKQASSFGPWRQMDIEACVTKSYDFTYTFYTKFPSWGCLPAPTVHWLAPLQGSSHTHEPSLVWYQLKVSWILLWFVSLTPGASIASSFPQISPSPTTFVDFFPSLPIENPRNSLDMDFLSHFFSRVDQFSHFSLGDFNRRWYKISYCESLLVMSGLVRWRRLCVSCLKDCKWQCGASTFFN